MTISLLNSLTKKNTKNSLTKRPKNAKKGKLRTTAKCLRPLQKSDYTRNPRSDETLIRAILQTQGT